MKTSPLAQLLLTLALCGTALAASAPASAPSAPKTRIGVYDSRAVAYAYFWSPAECARRDTLIAEAKAAKASGDTARLASLSHTLSALQAHSHLQVFSTAPATEALAALEPQLPALLAELGVDRLVSRWDDATLRAGGTAPRLDVTDRLVRALFTPTEKHRKIIASLLAAEPLPLAKAEALERAGKL